MYITLYNDMHVSNCKDNIIQTILNVGFIPRKPAIVVCEQQMLKPGPLVIHSLDGLQPGNHQFS